MTQTSLPQLSPPANVRPRLRVPGFFSELVRTIIFVIAVTVLFDMAIPRSLVDGRSMEPSFVDGDRLIVSRINYLLGQPARGEVIVFNSLNPNEPGVMLIKRVVGLPGETVSMVDQQVHINGVPLNESYTKEACNRCPDQSWVLGLDEYFVMGDNRNASQDSRRFGAVGRDHIVGEVLFRYWPLNSFGLILGIDGLPLDDAGQVAE